MIIHQLFLCMSKNTGINLLAVMQGREVEAVQTLDTELVVRTSTGPRR